MYWFKIGKGVRHGCILYKYPAYLTSSQSTSCKNAGLVEVQAGIKITEKNINNLRYADNTTLMAESEEELKSLLMKVKEESEKAGLKLNIQKTNIMASSATTSLQIDEEKMGNSNRLYFLGFKITEDGDCSHEIKSCLLLGKKAMGNLDGILIKQKHYFTDKGLYSQGYGLSNSHEEM